MSQDDEFIKKVKVVEFEMKPGDWLCTECNNKDAEIARLRALMEELESRGGHLCVHSGLWRSVADGKDYICPDCRNTALEEAAHYVERLGLHPDFNPEQHAGVCVTVIRDGSKVAAGIRGLKK